MASAAARSKALDAEDSPLAWSSSPMEPGDPAYHRDEIVLYWPHVGAEAWALGVECASGGELDEAHGQTEVAL